MADRRRPARCGSRPCRARAPRGRSAPSCAGSSASNFCAPISSQVRLSHTRTVSARRRRLAVHDDVEMRVERRDLVDLDQRQPHLLRQRREMARMEATDICPAADAGYSISRSRRARRIAEQRLHLRRAPRLDLAAPRQIAPAAPAGAGMNADGSWVALLSSSPQRLGSRSNQARRRPKLNQWGQKRSWGSVAHNPWAKISAAYFFSAAAWSSPAPRAIPPRDAGALHRLHLVRGGAAAAGDDRAGMAHAAARRRGGAGDEADHRLLHLVCA